MSVFFGNGSMGEPVLSIQSLHLPTILSLLLHPTHSLHDLPGYPFRHQETPLSLVLSSTKVHGLLCFESQSELLV